MSNSEHVKILNRSIEEWNQWRIDHHDVRPDLRGVDLSGADLSDADVRRADFSRAKIGYTILGNVDLSKTKGLETIKHIGPSTIGIDTIYKSEGTIPDVSL